VATLWKATTIATFGFVLAGLAGCDDFDKLVEEKVQKAVETVLTKRGDNIAEKFADLERKLATTDSEIHVLETDLSKEQKTGRLTLDLLLSLMGENYNKPAVFDPDSQGYAIVS
jgi:hypothetical protein